jgi:hypothetical protein
MSEVLVTDLSPFISTLLQLQLAGAKGYSVLPLADA